MSLQRGALFRFPLAPLPPLLPARSPSDRHSTRLDADARRGGSVRPPRRAPRRARPTPERAPRPASLGAAALAIAPPPRAPRAPLGCGPDRRRLRLLRLVARSRHRHRRGSVGLLPAGLFLGGAPANVACHLNELGRDATVVSRVGDDELGREVLRRLASRGLGVDDIQVDDGSIPTGFVVVTMEGSMPSYDIVQPSAWDAMEPTDGLIAAAEDAVVVYGRSRRETPGRAPPSEPPPTRRPSACSTST